MQRGAQGRAQQGLWQQERQAEGTPPQLPALPSLPRPPKLSPSPYPLTWYSSLILTLDALMLPLIWSSSRLARASALVASISLNSKHRTTYRPGATGARARCRGWVERVRSETPEQVLDRK